MVLLCIAAVKSSDVPCNESDFASMLTDCKNGVRQKVFFVSPVMKLPRRLANNVATGRTLVLGGGGGAGAGTTASGGAERWCEAHRGQERERLSTASLTGPLSS